MRNFFSRINRRRGSSSPRRQRGVVTVALLNSLFATLLALAMQGFSINSHPDLAGTLRFYCLNYEEETDPQALLNCANAMIQVATQGFTELLQSENGATGMGLLALSDSSGVDFGFNPYRVICDPRLGALAAGREHTVEIKVWHDRYGLDTKNVPVTISVAGSNGYSNSVNGVAGYRDPYYLTIPGAPGGTNFTITVTASPSSIGYVTKTCTMTVPQPPSYSGTYQVQGTVKRFTNFHGTQYTCSCTLTQIGKVTATIDYVTSDSSFGGKVVYADSSGTLSNCATTPAGINACSPDYSGESWAMYLNNLSTGGIIAGKIPDVTWWFNDYGGPCSPLTTFSGTISYYTSIAGTVTMTPKDPTYQYCTVIGGTAQFTLQRNDNPTPPAHPISALPR